jgi:hypothetical protein
VYLALTTNEEGFLQAIIQADIEPSQGSVSQQGEIAQGLVKPPAQSSNYKDLMMTLIYRITEGYLEIGFVFITGILENPRTRLIERLSIFNGQRVQVTDEDNWQ